MDLSPLNLNEWMRIRLPELNRSLDENPDTSEFALLCEEVLRTIRNDDHSREMFTYISMVHMSLYHHRETILLRAGPLPENFNPAFDLVENAMIDLASKLGVEHRFLATFYLLYNPEMGGKAAQFRSGNDEAEFANANRIGIIEFRTAALALLEAAKLFAHGAYESQRIAALLQQASVSFDRIVELNRGLAQRLVRKEFELLTKYFGKVNVRGRELRGVNAGDQPWSYIIDLLLGVDLKRAFETAFDRMYPANVRDSADAIRHEFELNDYLRKNYLLPEDYARLEETLALVDAGASSILIAIEDHSSGNEQEMLTALFQEVIKKYVMTSNTHFGLAKKYVPVDSQTHEQIGSSGTNIEKFLKRGLIDERMKILYGHSRVPIS
ncbi:MAG TPA: monodechloroaminopyrrolnitrin synthase PrnB family protein [Candidatus Kapabacteria bacterium]|jgi:hypothetical protein|nr:monodechloroaminopyrrolnitrin synthase PrnB family protein [Candidatus Kapabacteria bacterium]